MSHIHIIYSDVSTGNYPTINHGIAFLSGALKKHGYEVSFHHVIFPEDPDKVASRAINNGPDVIGFSLCHNQVQFVEKYVQAIRRTGTKAFLIAGGIFPTTDPENSLNRLEVDAIAIGEAENVLLTLMDSLSTGKERIYQTKGFHFRMPDGSILKNNIPSLNQDLSELPLPDYSVYNLEKIIKDSGGLMNMMLTRGCPYNCFYCCNNILTNVYPEKRKYFRQPSVEHAINLIKNNLGYAEHIERIGFDDDLLNLNKEWFLAFSETYQKEIGLPYTMNSRIETLTDDIIEAMKKSGCKIVNIGVESGNQWIRENLLNRHYSNEQLVKTFSKLRDAGILTSTFNMTGLPFETKNQMLDTLKINKKIRPYRGHCFYFYPYPKTKLYQICRDFDLLWEGYEELSGYFASPAIKLTHVKQKDAIRITNKLRLYLCISRIMTNLRLRFLTPALYYLMIPFAGLTTQIYRGNLGIMSKVRSIVYRTTPFK